MANGYNDGSGVRPLGSRCVRKTAERLAVVEHAAWRWRATALTYLDIKNELVSYYCSARGLDGGRPTAIAIAQGPKQHSTELGAPSIKPAPVEL